MHLIWHKGENCEQILKLLSGIFQHVPIGIAISYGKEPHSGINDGLVSINTEFEQITGRSSEELLKSGWAKFTHPDDLEEVLKNFSKLQSGEINSFSMDKRYIRPDGSIIWVYLAAASFNVSQKKHHIFFIREITKQKEMETALAESERSKSVLLSHLPGLAYNCVYDRNWTMRYVSSGCFELTGYYADDLLNNNKLSYNDLIAPEYQEILWNEWARILAERIPLKYEYEIITANGNRKWVLELGQGVYNKQGEVIALEGIILDISERKEIENNLKYDYEHDKWTGLFNRSCLENLLLSDAKTQSSESRAVIGINLSAVQALTTTYGFHYTQDFIKKIADTLSVYCKENRMLFNTYENRFVFYLKGYKSRNELVEFCGVLENTLESLLSEERIVCGIGIVEIDENNARDVDRLLKNLLIASEKAMDISNEYTNHCFFDLDMVAQINREDYIKQELNLIAAGVDNTGLFLQYQPILDSWSGRICGFEALARLTSSIYGLISPLEFIPLAEKTKLIIPIGEIIIYKALCFLKKLMNHGFDDITISINISPIQLLKSNFSEYVYSTIKELEVNPGNICLEITESAFSSNYQDINIILCGLKDYGIHIAIDDFGKGYSSLSRERELKVDCLKIDKIFIDKLLAIGPEKAITSDIISIAHKMGHCAVAEGVEHQIQKQYLQGFGCDKIQGYLISKPLDEEAAIELLYKSTLDL